MIQTIQKTLVMLLLVIAFTSCNQGPTLQTYFVDNELKPGFTSLDIPTSFLNVEATNLTPEQIEVYQSVNKLNMLGFKLDENNSIQFKTELIKITAILKADKYQELMRGGNSKDGKFMIKFIGDPERLDELIVFGSANDKGFLVLRILGNDMKADQLVKLAMSLDKASISDSQVKQFMNFFE